MILVFTKDPEEWIERNLPTVNIIKSLRGVPFSAYTEEGEEYIFKDLSKPDTIRGLQFNAVCIEEPANREDLMRIVRGML